MSEEINDVEKRLRAKVKNEETLTLDEIRQAIAVVRKGRMSACFASMGAADKKTGRKGKKKENDQLTGDLLEGL